MMVDSVAGRQYFHINRIPPYSNHAAMAVGQVIAVGGSFNPFFGYYDEHRTLAVNTPTGIEHVSMVNWMKRVREGSITPNNLPITACEIVEHHAMLVRELLLEEIRLVEVPEAPSRQRCMWLLESWEDAEYWRGRLPSTDPIVRVSATGTAHVVDARLMPYDSVSLSEMRRLGRAYWRGEMSDQPEREVLFVGNIEVIEIGVSPSPNVQSNQGAILAPAPA
jgi:hypothetical protein